MTGLFFYVFSVIVSKSVKECPAKAVALEIDPQKTQKTQNAPKGARRNLIHKRHKRRKRRCSVSASLAPRGEPPARWLGLPPDGGGAVGTGAALRRGRRRSSLSARRAWGRWLGRCCRLAAWRVVLATDPASVLLFKLACRGWKSTWAARGPRASDGSWQRLQMAVVWSRLRHLQEARRRCEQGQSG